jgi:shikimate kinase
MRQPQDSRLESSSAASGATAPAGIANGCREQAAEAHRQYKHGGKQGERKKAGATMLRKRLSSIRIRHAAMRQPQYSRAQSRQQNAQRQEAHAKARCMQQERCHNVAQAVGSIRHAAMRQPQYSRLDSSSAASGAMAPAFVRQVERCRCCEASG